MINNKHQQEGFMLIEALIGVVIGAVFVVTTVSLVIRSIAVANASQTRFTGELLARESIEVLRDIEQSSPASLFAASCLFPLACHPQVAGGMWGIVPNAEVLSMRYQRTLYLEPVFRNIALPSRPIVSAGDASATLDSNTRKAVVQVTWEHKGVTQEAKYEIYVHQ
jgi:type II secretory pathway pseudopilin PulG